MLNMLNLLTDLATSQFQLGKISNVYDAQDGSINIYKTKSSLYNGSLLGLSVK